MLAAGDPQAPPLLSLHGLNVGAPRHTELFLPLTERYRVYVPDTPGQIGQSAPAAPRWASGDYGAWVLDILDGLGLGKVHALGMSFGAAVLLQAASHDPARMQRAALIVPAGITPVNAPGAALRLVLPAMLYRLLRWQPLLRAQANALATESTPDVLELLDLVAATMRPIATVPPAFHPRALRDFRAPVMLAVARHDIFFPLANMLRRAPQILPGLVELRVMAQRHIPSQHEQVRINEQVLRFFNA